MNTIYLPNLKSIHLKHFSLYPNGLDFRYRFVNGVNLIFGGNGVGKTTFISLIKYGLIGLYKKDFGFRRVYQGKAIIGRQQLPGTFFANRMDSSYDQNDKARIILSFKINHTTFEVTRQLQDAILESVKITEKGYSYFLKGTVQSQAKFERLEEKEKLKSLQTKYEEKVVAASNFSSFDDLIFFVNLILFFDESHKTILWDEDEEDILGRLSSKYFNKPELDLEREKALNAAQYHDSLSRHKSEDIRAINNVIKSIKESSSATDTIKNAAQEIEKTKSQIDRLRNKLNSIHSNIEQLTSRRRVLNNDKNFLGKEISSLDSKITDAEQKAYQQIWSKLNPKYKAHFDNIKANHSCPMCNKSLTQKQVNAIIKKDNECFLCSQVLVVKQSQSADLAVLTETISPLLVKQQQIDATISKIRDKIDDLDQEYRKQELALFEQESKLRNLEHSLNTDVDSTDKDFEFKAMLAEINKLEAEKRDHQELSKIESEKVNRITARIESENLKITTQLSSIFSEFAEKFLGVPSKLTYEDFKDGKGKRFVPVINGSPRLTSEELSESQRFFIDHSYRMSLLHLFYTTPAFFVCETPDSSLDISYERNAADVFLNYLKQPNALIITSNLNNSEFLEYIINEADRINYVNLLEIGRRSPIQQSSSQLTRILNKIKTKLDAKVN